ncbi:MAG: hypothetical protein A2W26_03205 [Acidobacteria bacterium RBG_16_64_8]|nr:MAG: hypothetical protein A2W26_03205 [Acidobacteria bacterium RBG_16_64_8]
MNGPRVVGPVSNLVTILRGCQRPGCAGKLIRKDDRRVAVDTANGQTVKLHFYTMTCTKCGVAFR